MNVNETYIIGGAIIALLAYLIATHKIDLAKLKGDLQADLAKIHATAQATHAAALAPVTVSIVPVAPVATTDANVLAAAPAGSPVANSADNPALRAYDASGDARGGNAGGNVVSDATQVTSAAADDAEHRKPDFDPANPQSVRYFEGGPGETVTKRYPAIASGALNLSVGERPDNLADLVDVTILGPGVSYTARGCHLSWSDKVPGVQQGASYDVAITAAAKFVTEVRLGMLPG